MVVHLMLYQVGASKVVARDTGAHRKMMHLKKCYMLLRHAAWLAHRELHEGEKSFGASRFSVGETRSRTVPIYWAELRIIAELAGMGESLDRLITATAGGYTPLLSGDEIKFRFARLAYQELLCGDFFACVLTQDQSLTRKLFGNNLELVQLPSWQEPILHCMSSLNYRNARRATQTLDFTLRYIIEENSKGKRKPYCIGIEREDSRVNPHAKSLLFAASRFGSKVLVETLLDFVPIHCKCKEGRTALHLAARHGHNHVVSCLMLVKAVPKGAAAFNDTLRTPIQEAILNGHVNVYRTLTRNTRRRGFPTDKVIRDYGPLPDPVSRRSSVCSSEKSFGKTVSEIHDMKQNITPLMLAAYEGTHGAFETALQQIPTEVSVNQQCSGAMRATALCFATENGRSRMVSSLLQRGADIRLRYGPKRCSLLYWPCFAGHYEVVQELLLANVPPDDTSSGVPFVNELSPLHAAAAVGHVAVIELLLAHGAQLLVCYKPLMLRPMHLAAFFGSDDVYNFFLSRGDAGKADRGGLVAPEDLRYLYEHPPRCIPRHLRKLSRKIEKLF